MGSVIDTLEVMFTANTSSLSNQLSLIASELNGIRSAGALADASLRNLAGSLDFGMAKLRSGAYSAGAAVGQAFANGLRSKKSAVNDAVSYLTSAALAALRKLAETKTTATANAYDASVSGVTRFDTAAMKTAPGAESAAGAGEKTLIIPINVDGIKLGEACVKGLSGVSKLTGRSVIAY